MMCCRTPLGVHPLPGAQHFHNIGGSGDVRDSRGSRVRVFQRAFREVPFGFRRGTVPGATLGPGPSMKLQECPKIVQRSVPGTSPEGTLVLQFQGVQRTLPKTAHLPLLFKKRACYEVGRDIWVEGTEKETLFPNDPLLLA